MPDLTVVGRIVKAHGLKGEVAVEVLSDVPGRFEPGIDVHVGGTRRRIVASRAHQGRLLLVLDGIDDRTAAEGLRGATLTAPPVDVSDSDTYFAHELVGMAVVLEDGTWLGDVADLVELPPAAGYDLLEIDADGVLWYLPAADELVEVADADGVDVLCLVDPPPGLVPDDVLPAVATDQDEDAHGGGR